MITYGNNIAYRLAVSRRELKYLVRNTCSVLYCAGIYSGITAAGESVGTFSAPP